MPIVYPPGGTIDPDEPKKLPCSNVEDCKVIRDAIAARPAAEQTFWNTYWKEDHLAWCYDVWTNRTGAEAGNIVRVNGYTQAMANAWIALQLGVSIPGGNLAHPRPEDDGNLYQVLVHP